MPFPKKVRLEKSADGVDVDEPIEDRRAELGNQLGLDVTESAIEHNIIEGDNILEGGEELEVQYVEDNGVPEMAEEVIMQGEYVTEFIDEEQLHEDDMAESLVALSRSGEFHDKSGGEFVVENIEPRRSHPRILRRFGTSPHQQFVDQPHGYVDTSEIVVEEYHPVSTAGRDTRFTPRYPVAVARRGSTPNVRNPYPKSDWREDQCKKLLVCDVLESLPEDKQESFKRLLDMLEPNWPGYRESSKRRYPVAYYTELDSRPVSPHGRPQKIPRAVAYERRYMDQPRYVVTNPSSSNSRVVAMIPFQEKHSIDSTERSDAPEMPELIQGDMNEGERCIDPHDIDEGGEVDIETYEEDHRDNRKPTLWLDNKGRVVDVVPSRGTTLIYPEMRQDIYGSSDLRSLSASHGKEAQDERFCPSCRMTMKRSIYYHHGRLIRKYGRCDIFTPKRFPCGSPGCHERLGTLERLCEHMYQVHRAPTDIKKKLFENEAQFDEFLRELESRGGNFRMSRGNKTIKEGIVQYFRCNRIFSIAKDKALRIVDDINAGTYEAVKDITQPMDPFGKETSTKPYLRTEEACTAFFRKTYLNDGTIEVRYCDYHLHGDERLRLPAAIRNRIHDMSKKKLPLPVIVMVLQKECHRFCMPGTALERRIMAVTPREVQLVAQSVQRRLDAAEKKNVNLEKADEISGQLQHMDTDEQVDADNGREDHEAAENLLDRGHDHNDCHEHLEPADEITEECTEGGDGVDFSTEGRGEGGELTELELAVLEEYERNRGVILTDFQSLKREENRKRLCRERVRARIYTLGRAMRNIQFSDFECDLLVRSEQMLEAVVELWNARMESGPRADPIRFAPKGNAYADINRGSSSEGSADQNESTTAQDCSATVDSVASPTTESDRASDIPSKSMPEAGDDAPPTHSSAKRVVKSRARRVPRPEKQTKEGRLILTAKSRSSQATPAVTRLGRVIKRKKILDV